MRDVVLVPLTSDFLMKGILLCRRPSLKLSILSRVSNVSPCNSQFDWGIESFCVVNKVISKICLKLVHGCKVSFLKMFSCREHFAIIQIFGATMKRIMLEEDRQCLTHKKPN